MAVLIGIACFATWQVQDWRYGQQLAEQTGLHQNDLTAISNAATDQQRTEQDKRLALEQRLAIADQTHYQELSHAQTHQARLRYRLATADLRLSVLLAAPAQGSGCGVPATTGAGRVDHGAARGELDPAHAQRVIRITGDGDQGLIALTACQDYILALKR